MTDRETLRALIKRVEEATKADDRLDEDIEAALGWPLAKWTSNPRPFTSSLDAAASLAVTTGWTFALQYKPDVGWCATVGSSCSHLGQAATPALALTAAALRARLAEMEASRYDDAEAMR